MGIHVLDHIAGAVFGLYINSTYILAQHADTHEFDATKEEHGYHHGGIAGNVIEGKGAVTIRDLVKNSLRMRPDRIIVGEVRGGEALDMLQAMNTGHDGSLTTAHANSPRDVLSRLETMVLMSGLDLPVRAIRDQISSALDLIIHQERIQDGSRKITYITEVQKMEGDVIVLQDLFRYKQTGFDENGKALGQFMPTGLQPQFLSKFKAHNVEFPKFMQQAGVGQWEDGD